MNEGSERREFSMMKSMRERETFNYFPFRETRELEVFQILISEESFFIFLLEDNIFLDFENHHSSEKRYVNDDVDEDI